MNSVQVEETAAPEDSPDISAPIDSVDKPSSEPVRTTFKFLFFCIIDPT